MKYLLILLLIATGCGKTHPDSKWGIQIGSTSAGYSITQFEWQGHIYITVNQGGTIHAEHCQCKQ